MEFQQVVQQRRMVRAFREELLAPEVVERILANGNRAPSAGFTQGYGFLVLEAAEERARFWQTVATAAHLDRYAEPDKGWTDRDEGRWPIPYWYIDTGFAALLMLLTAVDEELGGLFFGLPLEVITAVRAAFGVPADHEPIGVLAIGHPAPGGSTGSAWRGRRSLEQVAHRGHW